MKQDNTRFRCPLRNEWDAAKEKFEAMARSAGRDGVMARLMLDFMPVMCDVVERERDRGTAPPDFFDAVAATAGALIEEGIEQRTIGASVGREQHFDRMMHMINRIVRPRLARASRILIPQG